MNNNNKLRNNNALEYALTKMLTEKNKYIKKLIYENNELKKQICILESQNKGFKCLYKTYYNKSL